VAAAMAGTYVPEEEEEEEGEEQVGDGAETDRIK
jgi:hypothetical protein